MLPVNINVPIPKYPCPGKNRRVELLGKWEGRNKRHVVEIEMEIKCLLEKV